MRSCNSNLVSGGVSTRFFRILQRVGAVLVAGIILLATSRDQDLAAAEAPAATGQAAKPLFDGKSLEGWEGDKNYFRVEDGAIVAGKGSEPIPHNEFLCTTKEYGDFELELKVKALQEEANGGIQFRSRRVPNDHEVSGFQADVGKGWWGKLYDESRRNRVLAAPENEQAFAKSVPLTEWNHYKIRCQGDHIQLWVNGQKSVDYTETDPTVAKRGVIAVQIHSGPATEILYKDITIKELGASE